MVPFILSILYLSYLFYIDKASDISVRVLKRVAVHVAENLSGFIYKFMELGTFQKLLKIGKISPIHKKGDVHCSVT